MIHEGQGLPKKTLSPQLPSQNVRPEAWLTVLVVSNLGIRNSRPQRVASRQAEIMGGWNATGPMALGMSWKMWLCPLQTSTKIVAEVWRKDIHNIYWKTMTLKWFPCICLMDRLMLEKGELHASSKMSVFEVVLRTKLSWTSSLAWWNEDKQNLRYFSG